MHAKPELPSGAGPPSDRVGSNPADVADCGGRAIITWIQLRTLRSVDRGPLPLVVISPRGFTHLFGGFRAALTTRLYPADGDRNRPAPRANWSRVNSAGGRIDVSACLAPTGSGIFRASAGAEGLRAEMAGEAVAVIGYDTALCSPTDSGGGAIVTARPGTSRLCTQN